MNCPKYIEWIAREDGIKLQNGKDVSSFTLDYKINEEFFDDWALHIRRHYISDKNLQDSEIITGLSASAYLKKYVIPQREEMMGETARSNDLTEILIADILEFIEGYQTPRCKQYTRSGKNQSEHGTDIIAYKYHQADKKANIKDELLAVEVKASLTKKDYAVIENAIHDSQKDEVRLAYSINYYRLRLKELNRADEAAEIARFMNKAEREYKTTYIAAAVNSLEAIPDNIIIGISDDGLKMTQKNNQRVFFVHGTKLMNLTHQIYERCTQ